MFFIDNTCLISDATSTKMKYLSLSKEEDFKPITFNVGEHDSSLSKKVRLIEHFKSEMAKQKQLADKKLPSEQIIKEAKLKFRKETKANCMNIYVKKCGSRNNFRYFLFNNNVLQGIFKDGTEMLISPSNNLYINKYGEHKAFISSDELK